MNRTNHLFKTEIWQQIQDNIELWETQNGLLVNNEALEAREDFYTIVRVGAKPATAPGFRHAKAA